MKRKNVIIMGAAGRDFHNFNVFFRQNRNYNVVAFTAAQIPDIAGRRYPAKLSKRLYPHGIPIYDESMLGSLIKRLHVDVVVFAYSDVSHEYVMHKASLVLSSGASFWLLGPSETYLKSKKPVIAVCAVRTGAGKSPTSRRVAEILRNGGKKVVVIRHPMPYGDLARQSVQRFASMKDLEKSKCTIEEREEYEPHIENGVVVYAGVDYAKILGKAEKEADVIVFDGGNNDFSLIKPDLQITVVDPHRAGHELLYHPGETNFLLADAIVINKIDSARPADVKKVMANIRKSNPGAAVVRARSSLMVDRPEMLRGRKALVIEDGPTMTHGGMTYGAGTIAARKYRAKIIPAERFAAGSIRKVYGKYPKLHMVLPAMGYSTTQIRELEKTINSAKCDVVVDGSPVNLSRIIRVNKPVVNVRYYLDEVGSPNLKKIITRFLERKK